MELKGNFEIKNFTLKELCEDEIRFYYSLEGYIANLNDELFDNFAAELLAFDPNKHTAIINASTIIISQDSENCGYHIYSDAEAYLIKLWKYMDYFNEVFKENGLPLLPNLSLNVEPKAKLKLTVIKGQPVERLKEIYDILLNYCEVRCICYELEEDAMLAAEVENNRIPLK